ncbi:MAG: DEAD/DEAH box helicase [Chloroflexota bacterium]
MLTPVEPAFSHFFNFPFDPFQLESMHHIRAGHSVMVAAPTSSGKTVVAEYALWRALEAGRRAIYTTPIKALSNQKRRDLEALFPGKVGLLTGDRSENAEAPIVVMTTEVLRNMLVEDAAALDRVQSVVFDEIHYLADPERGTVWEEAIITCSPAIQLICLSATIANAEEIAQWIGETHGEIALVRHDERPVPLEHFYFTQERLHLVRDELGERRALFPREGKLPPPHPAPVIEALAEAALLPAIWFAFSRQAVEDAAGACARSAPRLNAERRTAIAAAITWTLDSLPLEDRKLPQLSTLILLLHRGVGFHHAGLLPPLKELVERLFIEGHLSVVCATDTLAIGINMPARTVVISNLARPVGGLLTPNDFRQLTGRAGRRGIDDLGAVVMLPGRSYRFEDAYRELCGPLQPVESAFRLRYGTLLSSLDHPDRLAGLIRSSLRQFQMKGVVRRSRVQLELVRAQLEGAEDDPEMLSYLELAAALSSAEKEQKRARNARTKAGRNPGIIRRYERARANRERFNRELRGHPRHGQAMALERHDPERMALLREFQREGAHIAEAELQCTREAESTAAAVRTVLTRLGYLNRQGPTRKARGLREIVANAGIVLSELNVAGAFDGLEPDELAEAVSWFASDSRRRRDNLYRLPHGLDRLRREARRVFLKINELEAAEGIELAQGPSEWFYGATLAWCRGESVGEITERIELGEGDVVGTLNKTVDLLDQLESMAEANGDVHLAQRAREARRILMRGLVAMMRTGERDDVALAALTG